MEFEKVRLNKKFFYWTWRDLPFLPYAWLEEKDLKDLKDRQSTIEKDLKYQQNCNETFKNIRNFNLKLI